MVGSTQKLNMKNAALSLIINLWLIFGLCACSNEKAFEIKVVNETGFKLDSVAVSGNNQLTVNPNQTSSLLQINYDPNAAAFFSEPFFKITIRAFSDSTKTYNNANEKGYLMPVSNFKEGTMNYINIKLIPHATDYSDPTAVFSITVN